ncbi:MAG TPA: hypothetical protein VIL60_06330 [Rhodanobacter sp.]
MAIFKSKERCLDDEEHSWLYVVITSEYLIRPRYVSAFLTAFSEDLAAQMPAVVSAGVQVHTTNHGSTQLTDGETKHLLTLTCVIIAVAKWRQLSAYKTVFPPDVEKAIWLIAFICGDITDEIAPDIRVKARNGISAVLGNDTAIYFEDPDVIEAERTWDRARGKLVEEYDEGEIDESDFASGAYELLESCPYASQQYS